MPVWGEILYGLVCMVWGFVLGRKWLGRNLMNILIHRYKVGYHDGKREGYELGYEKGHSCRQCPIESSSREKDSD
jgi:hypothetical protein